jgi:hypothetical protein
MAAWLVQLRARLLLPADAPAQQLAVTVADKLRTCLFALEDMQALAARWNAGHSSVTTCSPAANWRFSAMRSRPDRRSI